MIASRKTIAVRAPTGLSDGQWRLLRAIEQVFSVRFEQNPEPEAASATMILGTATVNELGPITGRSLVFVRVCLVDPSAVARRSVWLDSPGSHCS